jgi:hypothetical protein
MIDATVIIGHGPSLKDSNMGQYIDNFKYVIRFPYFKNWQIPKNYGTKTSYFCVSSGKQTTLKKRKIPDRGYLVWNKHGESIGENMDRLIKKFGGKNFTDILVTWQAQLKKCRYPFFSSGTAAICAAAALINKPIIVLGCDCLKTGDTNNYIGSWFYEGRRKHEMGHPVDQERKIIDRISDHYNLKIRFK